MLLTSGKNNAFDNKKTLFASPSLDNVQIYSIFSCLCREFLQDLNPFRAMDLTQYIYPVMRCLCKKTQNVTRFAR